MPTRRRLTVLKAPGGFGKSTLLAVCCRHLRNEGIPVAWISVDEHDDPAVLDAYIEYACRSAAVGAAEGLERSEVPDGGKAPSGSESRTAILMREVADLEVPFVLVFDELERLENPESAARVDFLVKQAPPNVHLAFACRELPGGVDVVSALLEGRAAIVSTEELRFSRSEVAEFFERKLSQAQLASLMSESAGWPFALRIFRNEMASGGRRNASASRAIVENWVESRLLAGLGAEDREFLLDLGLFEWMDAALLDAVLERNDSLLRIDTMSVLAGMLEPVRGGGTDVWRLHPLIREYCVRHRFRETPERFRTIHRRIAEALARRGRTATAMRHAVEAGEPVLAGRILERSGGVRLWLREGLAELEAAERRLNEEIVRTRPRLGLVRCLALVLKGRMEEAREKYRSLGTGLGSLEVHASDAEFELAVDNTVVRGMLALYGGERFGSVSIQTLLADLERLAKSPRVDVLTRGHIEYGLCVGNNMTAKFEVARERAARAWECFGASRYMRMFVDVQVGQIAMAQGRVPEARALHRRAERVAKRRYALDPAAVAICGVHLQELQVECNRAAAGAELTQVPEALVTGSSPLQAYAAACGVVTDLKLRDEGVESALAAAAEMLDYVRGARLPVLVRYVSALRISFLAIAGRVGDGEKAWALGALAESTAGCLDLEGQTWREMETLSCARLRLMIGRERFDEGRSFAEELRAVAEGRGLRRTLMRALALSMVLEHRAGNAPAATGHVEEYVRLYVKTPYAAPLVRERETCKPLVEAFLRSSPDPTARKSARALLKAMETADAPPRPILTEREREVLERLEGQSDRQIAARLGLSTHGVRYHLRNVFTKLRARNRIEAVDRAREMGLAQGDS
ncbi:MAG: LuxR C-terminal-related transcriptional regulator [Immundisolibacterales bacterium]|nr:LuxR C-terminal-related transcriptional regulator [Immundisolibacterales bacterium]